MSIKHLGIVKNGVEDTGSDESREWAGALENYTLKPVNGKTELVIDFGIKDIPQEMLGYFMETWPKALSTLKELAEKN
jgi:hypothetical protein